MNLTEGDLVIFEFAGTKYQGLILGENKNPSFPDKKFYSISRSDGRYIPLVSIDPNDMNYIIEKIS